MSDQANGLREDVAFLRSMAEQGRRGPLLGGIFLAAAGLIYGAASFMDWGIETGHLPFAVSDGKNCRALEHGGRFFESIGRVQRVSRNRDALHSVVDRRPPRLRDARTI